PIDRGRFGLEDYTDHLITFMDKLGPRAHMVAICQPSVSALAAAAVMCEDNHPARPATLTLMAGPIDTRIQPTKVNEFAKSKPINWFEKNLINYVPFQCRGDRKSTRLNSSHLGISYAVFCLKKKKSQKTKLTLLQKKLFR